MNFALEENPPSRDFKLNKEDGFIFTANMLEYEVSQGINN